MTPVRTSTAVAFRQPSSSPDPRDVQREITQAFSQCELWYYFRDDGAGTPWTVLFRPTSQTKVGFGSLDACRRWTAWPGAISDLRMDAHSIVTTGRVGGLAATTEEFGHACWTYLMHIQHIGTPDNTRRGPTGRCRCGGWLAAGPAGIRHVDCCAQCWSPTRGWRVPRPCVPFRIHHTACLSPTWAGPA